MCMRRPSLLLFTAGLCVVVVVAAIAGCNRTVDPTPPAPRYATLGPKEEFPEHLRGTIFELVDVGGTQPLSAAGYGLVVNLENTGRDDGIPTAVREHILNTAITRGFQNALTDGPLGSIAPAAVLADPRTAVVRVEGVIPPGAHAGQRIDVQVSALETNTTPSLARGFLWQTELHQGTVNARNPGELVNKIGVARGPLVVNPVYALAAPTEVKDDPAASASLRHALIPDGGVVQTGRRFVLKLRNPERRTARLIEQRINYHFGRKVAAAQNEALIYVEMPTDGAYAATGPGDWERFLGVAVHLFFNANDHFAAQQAERLAQWVQAESRTEEELLAVSYTWEGLGQVAMPQLVALMDDPNPAVAFAAARAAAHLEQPAAINALLTMAQQEWNPYNVKATRELGRLHNPGASLARNIRELLNEDIAPSPQVRIEAYEALARLNDGIITERRIGDKFVLHLTPGEGTPLVYAKLSGRPTIAIIGGQRDFDNMPHVREPEGETPLLVSAFGDRLTLTRLPDSDRVNLYQRLSNRADGEGDANQRDFVDMPSLPDLREVIGRLGGDGMPGERRIDLGYGEIVALLKKLGDEGHIVASGETVAVRLEDATLDQVDTAPLIPGFEQRQERREVQASAAVAE